MASESFLRSAHLLKVCQGDKVRVRDLIGYALPILEINIEQLRKFLQENDELNFLKELHKVKGSIGVIEPDVLYIRARDLEEDFKQLDQTARRQRAADFIQNLAVLRNELQRFEC